MMPAIRTLPLSLSCSVFLCHPGTCLRQPAHQDAKICRTSFCPLKLVTDSALPSSSEGSRSDGNGMPTAILSAPLALETIPGSSTISNPEIILAAPVIFTPGCVARQANLTPINSNRFKRPHIIIQSIVLIYYLRLCDSSHLAFFLSLPPVQTMESERTKMQLPIPGCCA